MVGTLPTPEDLRAQWWVEGDEKGDEHKAFCTTKCSLKLNDVEVPNGTRIAHMSCGKDIVVTAVSVGVETPPIRIKGDCDNSGIVNQKDGTSALITDLWQGGRLNVDCSTNCNGVKYPYCDEWENCDLGNLHAWNASCERDQFPVGACSVSTCDYATCFKGYDEFISSKCAVGQNKCLLPAFKGGE